MRNSIVVAGLALSCLTGAAKARDIRDAPDQWRGGLRRPVDLTLTVERQEGIVFSGTWASQSHSDPMVGALSADGKTLYLANDNGPMHGELQGPDRMEICRSLAESDRMLAACWLFARRR